MGTTTIAQKTAAIHQSPFKLFEPYSSNDKNIFFGRDPEIYALYSLLQQTRLVVIYGSSGTGKTSLINAGLPKVFKTTDWYRVSIRRKDNINASFQHELGRLIDQTEVTDLGAAINELHEIRWIPIYLVFDQFEEIFTLGTHEERLQFFKDIQKLLDKPLPCKIILSMREEYIGHLYDYEPVVPTLFDKRFRVEPMKDATVTDVVVQMCAVGGVQLEQGKETAAQILHKVKEGKQAAHLPYLQVYLHYLYENAMKTLGKPFFTEGVVNAVGALGNVLKRFIESQLEAAQTFFKTLGLPNDFAARMLDEFATDEGTKQSRKADDLSKVLNTEREKVKAALNYFSEGKLLRADEDDVERYEPVHDVVAKQIHELRSAEDKEFKAFARQLQLGHEAWVRDNKPTQRLLNELDLSKVAIYEDRLTRLPNYEAQLAELINKSREQVDYLQRIERTRRRVLMGITIAALIGMVVAVMFYLQANEAKKKAFAAEKKATAAIAKICFYKDRFGLAYDKEKGLYGFIDKELNTKIDFKYKEASPFDETGFAKVQLEYIYYLIDTLGQEYKLATDVNHNQLDSSITALDLRNQYLKAIPSEVFEQKQLKVLLLGGNSIAISDSIAELSALQYLELSVNYLNQIPESLSQLSALQTLDLGHNELKSLPESLSKLTALQTLDLTSNQLTSLPEHFGKLTALQTLDLTWNQLTSLPESFSQLTALQDLDLASNQLTSLPEHFGKLSALQTLNLSSNKLTILPESFSQLTALQDLDLRENQLASLPEHFGKLSALQTLNLSSNKLTILPEHFGKLSALQILNLSSNKLTILPESFSQLSALQTLDLSNKRVYLDTLKDLDLRENQLASLPKLFSHLTALKTLNLARNEFKSLPESFSQLSALQTLNLSSNKLTILPESFSQLSALQTLKLSRNQLASLPVSFGKLTALQDLGLSRNQLEILPESFGKLTALQTLDLTGNQLTSLPASLSKLTALQDLGLKDNKLTSLPESFGKLTALKTLDLSGTKLTSLPKSFSQLTALQDLDLSKNQLTSLPESFGKLTALKNLDLSGTKLTSLPKSFSQLTALQTLDLSRIQLTKLPKFFSQLTALQDLNLSENKLTNLPEPLSQLTALLYLNLSGNQLKSLPEFWSKLTALQSLNLRDNQLTSLPASFCVFKDSGSLDFSKNPQIKVPDCLKHLIRE